MFARNCFKQKRNTFLACFPELQLKVAASAQAFPHSTPNPGEFFPNWRHCWLNSQECPRQLSVYFQWHALLVSNIIQYKAPHPQQTVNKKMELPHQSITASKSGSKFWPLAQVPLVWAQLGFPLFCGWLWLILNSGKHCAKSAAVMMSFSAPTTSKGKAMRKSTTVTLLTIAYINITFMDCKYQLVTLRFKPCWRPLAKLGEAKRA